jgi:PP-loop superfamily ATP-utilizing enzyme
LLKNRHQTHTFRKNEILNEDFAGNPENRCHYCKKKLPKSLKSLAEETGFKAVWGNKLFISGWPQTMI